ncbi:protein of unknown function [Candidatus Hydrogenisulfobacillus filiaventi]|uniref:Uncharacterized protein n=1 Tax=Candidatus Hydrogenisulfobacillus filiaventi TaxID=2707344 RepID=A0A6F8ZCZ4_9FIRM|nr:protein of unknown function [Candidatus Hydrogenisulfobacillus filiaventi]
MTSPCIGQGLIQRLSLTHGARQGRDPHHIAAGFPIWLQDDLECASHRTFCLPRPTGHRFPGPAAHYPKHSRAEAPAVPAVCHVWRLRGPPCHPPERTDKSAHREGSAAGEASNLSALPVKALFSRGPCSVAAGVAQVHRAIFACSPFLVGTAVCVPQ